MNRRTIFYIENRGKDWIFHWFIYMISGLRYINLNTSRNGQGCQWGSLWAPNVNQGKEKNLEFYEPEKLKKPFYICFKDVKTFSDYQSQTLDLLKDEFIVINESEILEEDIVVFNYGEKILNNPHHISFDGYFYLKNLFLSKIENDKSNHKNKKYYLSRSKSHLLDGNKNDSYAKRRQVVNEVELSFRLKDINIETIFLEDFNLKEKIDIFSNADLIISPNSGGLVFTLFSTQKTNIVEINVENPHQISHQYKDQCLALNIPYHHFICEKIDGNDNMKINIDEFITFLDTVNKN